MTLALCAAETHHLHSRRFISFPAILACARLRCRAIFLSGGNQ